MVGVAAIRYDLRPRKSAPIVIFDHEMSGASASINGFTGLKIIDRTQYLDIFARAPTAARKIQLTGRN